MGARDWSNSPPPLPTDKALNILRHLVSVKNHLLHS